MDDQAATTSATANESASWALSESQRANLERRDVDDSQKLVNALPKSMKRKVQNTNKRIEEVGLDLGAHPVVRFEGGTNSTLEQVREIQFEDIECVLNRCEISSNFSERSGIHGTLHRVSRILSEDGERVIGMTIRAGFAVKPDLYPARHWLHMSQLLVGPPGTGTFMTSLLLLWYSFNAQI
jgi:stage III sporulation protein SpoIIIAA